MGSKGFLYILPIVTLVLGIAIGKWWSDRDHEVARASGEESKAPQRQASFPSMLSHGSPSGGTPIEAPQAMPNVPPRESVLHRMIPSTGESSAVPPDGSVTPAAGRPGGEAPALVKEKPPEGPSAADGKPKADAENAGAAQMLAVLFTNPMFRQQFEKQMVSQVAESVKFTPAQQESARKELEGAMKPLIDAFSSQTKPDMNALEPKFNAMKDDWKRRLTPLLTSEQAAAFQDWLDQHHTLSVKMGMDEKGQPKDPDGK